MIVTGIGARKRPNYIRLIIENIMGNIAQRSIIRSGAADGCDTDFEDFAIGKEIFLPWKDFGNSDSKLYLDNIRPSLVDHAIEVIKYVHPAFKRLSRPATKLHTRNVFQVLGKNLDKPSDILICYTENGEIKGGTATAINIAKLFDVPVYNLGRIDDIIALIELGICDMKVLDILEEYA